MTTVRSCLINAEKSENNHRGKNIGLVCDSQCLPKANSFGEELRHHLGTVCAAHRFDISTQPNTTKKTVHSAEDDNDNDNDTLKEVPHPSNEGLALQARVSGPWPHKKESVLLVELARWKLASACVHRRCDSDENWELERPVTEYKTTVQKKGVAVRAEA